MGLPVRPGAQGNHAPAGAREAAQTWQNRFSGLWQASEATKPLWALGQRSGAGARQQRPCGRNEEWMAGVQGHSAPAGARAERRSGDKAIAPVWAG